MIACHVWDNQILCCAQLNNPKFHYCPPASSSVGCGVCIVQIHTYNMLAQSSSSRLYPVTCIAPSSTPPARGPRSPRRALCLRPNKAVSPSCCLPYRPPRAAVLVLGWSSPAALLRWRSGDPAVFRLISSNWYARVDSPCRDLSGRCKSKSFLATA